MQLPKSTTAPNRWLWFTAIASSILLVGFVLSLVDWDKAKQVVQSADRPLIITGVALLGFEGFITAMRFRLLSIGDTTYAQSLRASGWYVLLLLALPARLGEVAGVGTMKRYMGQTVGASAVNLFLQRIFDVLTLGAMFCIVSFQYLSGEQLSTALISALVIMAGLIIAILYLPELMRMVAAVFFGWRKNVWACRVMKFALQVRLSIKRHLDIKTSINLASLTIIKWMIILVAIACIVLAVEPLLNVGTAFGIGIAYNLAAVIPLQTIGGAGIAELALLGSFKWLGYTAATGAALAIAIRIALLVGPIIFGVLTLAYFELIGAGAKPGEARG
ncbi:MAG: lysylphosphatidylglycerol synthase transmembrane domain-containing protein [Gammaproteobacteria bacterium]